ncbi:hypothetical protein BY458DRAFT_56567 [Sporodiniella umbellata]|nr:hypothetical protein BY458DRAFT_56567 [Sporodiniella umbellata]
MFSNTHKHSSETFRKEQTSTWSTWSNQHNALSNSRALDHNRNDFESGSSPFQIKKDTKTHNGDGQSKIEIATALPAHRYDSSPRSGFSTDFQPTPVGVLSSTLENKDTQGTSAIAASYQSSPKASSQPLKEQLSIWTSPITRQPRKHGWMSLVNSDSTFMQSASKLSSSTNHTCSATSWSVEKNQMEAISGSISSDSSVVVRSFLKRNSHLVYKESKSQQWNSVIGSKHRIRPDLKSPNDNKPSNIHPQLDSTRVHLPKIAHTS